MRVLVTRPAEDSLRTAQELVKRGHRPVVAPLFEIRIIEGPELRLDGVQAILATSGNGIRALARRSGRRDVPVFAVGTRTAAAARAARFAAVADAGGDARELAALVRAQARPESGALLHVAAAHSTQELCDTLAREGFDIRRCVLYDAAEVRQLPSAAEDALGRHALDAVLVFSPRSARLLADCVRRAGLAGACERILACCISESAARALDGFSFREIRTASHPDQESLLALLRERAPGTQ